MLIPRAFSFAKVFAYSSLCHSSSFLESLQNSPHFFLPLFLTQEERNSQISPNKSIGFCMPFLTPSCLLCSGVAAAVVCKFVLVSSSSVNQWKLERGVIVVGCYLLDTRNSEFDPSILPGSDYVKSQQEPYLMTCWV
ncbi:hypothetical protein PoB_003336900 [Plakobranchus ocellatus]|uniref:Uncharacterized protein n=1 Tax=Plakobranchus ocellatus TaxID=259542 RepID=A0AAV4AKE2_9GAST|nr:hypothetical protein PoB_003336900 [Plakobranchus ocellatus]